VLEAHNKCCEPQEAVIQPPAEIKHCTLFGDPHMANFNGQNLVPQSPSNEAYKVGYFWLVEHDKVKIQAEFTHSNGNGDGYSSLKAIAIEVDGVLVYVKRRNGLNKVTVNGAERNVPFSHPRVEVVSVENLAEVNLAATHGNWGALQENHGKAAMLIRFPQFKDDHDVEYVKVYLRGDSGMLNAAIFMAKAGDLPSSQTVKGLCGNREGSQRLSESDMLPGLLSSGQDATTRPLAPVMPSCNPSERIVVTGQCEQCLDLGLHNRDALLEECISDRCVHFSLESLATECDFINEVGSLD